MRSAALPPRHILHFADLIVALLSTYFLQLCQSAQTRKLFTVIVPIEDPVMNLSKFWRHR